MNPVDQLLDAMRAVGLGPVKHLDLVGDGRLLRYRGEGDKPGRANCFVYYYGEPYPAAYFGSWRTWEKHKWKASSARPATQEERAALQRQMQAMQAARAAELAAVQASARERAARLWARGRPATDAHPYLQRKRVHAYGLRRLRDSLVIPARDAQGELHTLQFIDPGGTKRFLSGGRIAGCYFAIGRVEAALLICEGYATGATLHQATGTAVAIAFNAGNLLAVAQALRAKFPGLALVVCADDDAATAGNPGLTKAKAAAQAVGAALAVPQFEGVDHG